jgi:hypothetical protein
MQIGQDALTIDGPLEAMLFSWEQIWSLGVNVSNQLTASRSSTKAEYKAVANTAAKVMWIQILLTEIGISCPRYANCGVTTWEQST